MAIFMLSFAVLPPSGVNAHGEAIENIKSGPTGVLPDSILYGIDVLFEKIGDGLSFSANKKLTRLADHLDERIREYSLVTTAGKIKHAEKALLRYSQTIGRSEPLIEKLVGDSAREIRINEFTTKIMNHQEILAEIYAEISDEAHTAIKNAIDASEAAYQAIIKLASESQRIQIEEVKELYDSEVQNYLEPREIPPPAAPMPPDVQQPGEIKNPNTKSACVKTGCSGQVCADEEVVTTCEFRPEYECYKTAKCERQPSGECGWTSTPELRVCLEKAQ